MSTRSPRPDRRRADERADRTECPVGPDRPFGQRATDGKREAFAAAVVVQGTRESLQEEVRRLLRGTRAGEPEGRQADDHQLGVGRPESNRIDVCVGVGAMPAERRDDAHIS